MHLHSNLSKIYLQGEEIEYYVKGLCGSINNYSPIMLGHLESRVIIPEVIAPFACCYTNYHILVYHNIDTVRSYHAGV